jgi:hypothetical protein
VVLAFVVHFPGLWGEYTWDDNEWLIENKAVLQWDTFWELWVPGKTPHFFPLVTTSYWIEHKLWGLGVTDANGVVRGVGYHVTNLLLHAGASVLLFEIVRRLRLRGGIFAAWVAAVAFAIHPVNVETVAWVAERKNTLCAVFLFASAMFAFRAFGLYEGERGKRWDTLLGVGLFLCAMLSKTTACFLPPALLVMAWWKRGRVTKADVIKSVPYFVIGLTFGGLSVVLEKQVAGTSGAAFDFSPVQRVLIAGNAFWFYVQKLLVPYPVHQIYPRWPIEAGRPVTEGWLWVRPVLFALVLGGLVAFRKRLPRGPLAVMLLFAGGVFPALGFISFYTMQFTFVADHYVYLAAPFVLVLAAEGLVAGVNALWEWARAGRDEMRRWAMGGIAAVLLILMGNYAYGLSGLYRDGVLLWGYAYEHNKNSFFICLQYAIAWMNAVPREPQNMDLAGRLLDQAMALNPEDWRPWDAKARLLMQTGDRERAMGYLQEAQRRMAAQGVRVVE